MAYYLATIAEPATICLAGLGVMLLARDRRRVHRR
jgi:hypothetical protein